MMPSSLLTSSKDSCIRAVISEACLRFNRVNMFGFLMETCELRGRLDPVTRDSEGDIKGDVTGSLIELRRKQIGGANEEAEGESSSSLREPLPSTIQSPGLALVFRGVLWRGRQPLWLGCSAIFEEDPIPGSTYYSLKGVLRSRTVWSYIYEQQQEGAGSITEVSDKNRKE